MDDRDPHKTLDDVGKRIKALRGSGASDEAEKKENGNAGVALRVGIDLISGVAFGVIAGYLLDKWLDTSPWLLIVFFFLGTAAGIRNVFRTASSIQQQNDQ